MKVRKSSGIHEASNSSTKKAIRLYTDGSGARPDGKGSGFAWVRERTGEKHIERADGLTNNQAEYRGVLSGLESLPDNVQVEVFTDSQLVAYQFNGQYKVSDRLLAGLLSSIHKLIRRKRLRVIVTWIPREKNLAGKLA